MPSVSLCLSIPLCLFVAQTYYLGFRDAQCQPSFVHSSVLVRCSNLLPWIPPCPVSAFVGISNDLAGGPLASQAAWRIQEAPTRLSRKRPLDIAGCVEDAALDVAFGASEPGSCRF